MAEQRKWVRATRSWKFPLGVAVVWLLLSIYGLLRYLLKPNTPNLASFILGCVLVAVYVFMALSTRRRQRKTASAED